MAVDTMGKTYWLDLFTGETWEEFLANDAKVSGFRENRRKTASRVRPGDYFICYLTGISRFVGVLEVQSDCYRDETPIWKRETFPIRFKVKLILQLEPRTAVPVLTLSDRLSIFKNIQPGQQWSGFFRGSPAQFKPDDGEIILEAIRQASIKPIEREYDETKYLRYPKTYHPAKSLETRVVVTDKPTLQYEEGEGGKKAQQSYHNWIRDMIFEIGQIEGRISDKEYRINGERIDVAWKRIEAGNPYAVFEVQVGGNFYEALAKLKHAWDKWNSRPFLVTSQQYREKALEWIKGSFHEMERELRIIDCEKVRELHNAVKTARDLRVELGINIK
jgi:predicted RNA-binding protein